MRHCCSTTVLVVIFLVPFVLANEAWNIPTHSQYHIQTDEGPERYFQYQTQSGQYRKEKRLEDGTMIGTYAWIDANGLLWLRDYIADNKGYRILRSKNLYVGRDTPIERAVKAVGKVPASSGVLVKANAPALISSPSPGYPYSPSIKPQTTYLPPSHIPQIQISPNSGSGYGSTHLPADVSTLITSTESPLAAATPAVVHIPSTTASSAYLPPVTPSSISSTTQSNTYLPPVNSYSTSAPVNLYVQSPPTSTVLPPLASNAVDYSEYSGAPQYEHYNKPSINPYVFQNGPTYPIDKQGHTFNGLSNKIGNGYDPQYPEYDGVSVTNDGFRYYIPKAYHEEQSLPGNSKSGSFGYIDPFGIRRVIYYNASPEGGFQHRKNNRYVGFNATPYDPRPY